MREYYLTIKYTKPIPIIPKENTLLFNLVEDYIDTYGDLFIGLFNTYNEGLEAQLQWYKLYGDFDLCKDLNTIDHLEKCYQLEYKE